jgi:glutamine amidotransferase
MHPTDFSQGGIAQTGAQSPVSVVVIDYGLGNVRSVLNALEKFGADAKLSCNPEDLHTADGLILPGVGAFGDGMANLRNFGLIPHLNELVLEKKIPFLGICLGMQLLAQSSTEGGHHEGLGWLNASVVKLSGKAENKTLKIPHVGWNDVTIQRTCPALGLPGETKSYYFVHSYALHCHDESLITGLCNHGENFPAVVQKDNILAVQFHPEKSQKHGLDMLSNFLTVIRNNKIAGYASKPLPQTTSTKSSKREAAC